MRTAAQQRNARALQQPRVAGWYYVRQLLSNRMLIGVYLGQYCVNVLTYFFSRGSRSISCRRAACRC